MPVTSDQRTAFVIVAILAVVLYLVYSNVTGSISDDLSAASNYLPGSGGSGSTSTSSTGLYGSILDALSTFENVAGFHNNPGGVTIGGVVQTYPTVDAGEQANQNVIESLLSRGFTTVQSFVTAWVAGPNGDPSQYPGLQNEINHVANELGLDPSDNITDAIGGDDADDGDEG